MDKRKRHSPLPACRNGDMCFVLSPAHFDEWSHPHLDKILESEDSLTGLFVISEDSIVGAERINEQLKIIKAKQSQSGNVVKVQKLEEAEQQESQKVVTKTPLSNNTEVKKPTNDSKQGPAESKAQQKDTKVTSQSLADFFKERSRAFKAKEPETMRAQSPPKASVSKPKPSDEEAVMPTVPRHLQSFFPTVLPRGQMANKLRQAAPYNMFLTTVTDSPATYFDPLSVTFLDLLDPSLGELESSVQINYAVDIAWLLAQYTVAGVVDKPLLIIHGHDDDPHLKAISKSYPNIDSVFVKVSSGYGSHHAKMMLFFYKDKSMRVVISTANLCPPDWNNRTQGLWISERLPEIPSSSSADGESPTNFRRDLLSYLENYENNFEDEETYESYDIPDLEPYIDRIESCDFSSVKVFLVTSIPGEHRNNKYGLPRMGSLLSRHSAPVEARHPIILQSSAVGDFGSDPIKCSTEINGSPDVKLIYPTLKNVQQSFDGTRGADCLHYNVYRRYKHLCQWKSESLKRSQAIPHIKSYCRLSEDGLFWFLLTSCNMSKSAWSVTKKRGKQELFSKINNYEAGVAFFPSVILDDCKQFPMNEAQRKGDTPIFRLPFDVPLVPYDEHDRPFNF